MTIGQYLRPSRENLPVEQYVHPDVFERYREVGEALGLPPRFRRPLRAVLVPGRGSPGGRLAGSFESRVSSFELKARGKPRSPKLETRNRWILPAPAFLSGLLFALAFPPLEWVALLPLAPVPWLVALCPEERRGRALVSGFLFGIAYWCASVPWIVYVVTKFGGQSPVMGLVSLVLMALHPLRSGPPWWPGASVAAAPVRLAVAAGGVPAALDGVGARAGQSSTEAFPGT